MMRNSKLIFNSKTLNKMVTIVNYKRRRKEDGSEFIVLELQSGVELIQSQTTGKFYATSKRCYIPATFDEYTCKSIMGTEMKGNIVKVECEPFQFTIEATGEVVELNHRYEYTPEESELAGNIPLVQSWINEGRFETTPS